MEESPKRCAACRGRCSVQTEEAIPVKAHNGKDGTELDDEREGLDKLCAFYPQKVLRYNHVSCGGYGQELGKSLHNGYDDGFLQNT